MRKTAFVFCLMAFLAATPAMAQVDFSRYVALGDSFTAGFASGSLMDFYQERSYPAVLAAQAGADTFEQPLVSEPGLPPILELVYLVPNPVIESVGEIPGFPVNAELPGSYNNLGVPGATLFDMLFTTGDIFNLLAGNQDNVMHDLILRNVFNTALEQAIGLEPTFITVWIGNNDILPAWAVATPIEGVTMTPVALFEELYQNAIGALVTTNPSADIVLINLPYGTKFPFTTTVPPFVDIDGLPTPLMGTNGELSSDSLVTLPAASLIGMGFGLPGGSPLPEDLNFLTGEPGYVLRPEEIATIEGRFGEYNKIIAETAATHGLPVLDVNALFDDIASGCDDLEGEVPTTDIPDLFEILPDLCYTPIFGGIELSADFLIGGLFSYDGIHGQHIWSGLVAVELIDLINREFGADIPQVNMNAVLHEGDWQSAGVGPAEAKKTVLSPEAFKQLLDVLAPDLKLAPRVRRPEVRRPNPGDVDVRRKPNMAP